MNLEVEGGMRMKVFIVDDSEMLRERVISMISAVEGIQIVGQAEGVSGTVARIDDEEPDILILDLRLQDGNGLQILEDLADKAQRPIIIVLTNYPYPQYRDRCLAAGVEFFIDKATEFHKLNNYLESIKDQKTWMN